MIPTYFDITKQLLLDSVLVMETRMTFGKYPESPAPRWVIW